MESATHVAETFLAEAVIAGALVGIRKHTIRLVDLFELFLGVRFLAHIRVILARQFSEGCFDLIFRGVPSYTEYLVVIAIGHNLESREQMISE